MTREQQYITDAFGLIRDMNLSYWTATNNDGTTSTIGPATSREMAKMIEEGLIKSAQPNETGGLSA